MAETGDRATHADVSMRSSLASELEALHKQIAERVLALDPRCIDAAPAAGVASIRESVLAAIAAERRWIVGGMCGIAAPEIGSFGVEQSESGVVDYLHLLGSTGQISQTLLAALRSECWSTVRVVDDERMTVAGCVLKAIEEMAICLGRIDLLTAWWESASNVGCFPPSDG